MICRNCGTENEQGTRYCTTCGAMFEETPEQESTAYNRQETYNSPTASCNYTNNANNNGYYNNPVNNGGYYQNQNPAQPYYGTAYMPSVNDKAATVKDYLKWMLLYPLVNLIPVVGTAVYIFLSVKFAFDSSFTARANYFKAILIVYAISIGVVILMCLIMIPLLIFFADSTVSVIQELDPSIFSDGNFEYYFDMLIR